MNIKFLINEIHSCLQGEGLHLGKPSVLVRFQICNLRCSWCDTKYTHTYKSDSFNRYSLDELISLIEKFNIFHIIFTGGEPTLQNLGIIARTLKHKSSEYFFEVETNGTQIPHKKIKGFNKSDYDLLQWNVSPKFENAEEILNTESLKHWADLASENKNVFFKFVIRKKQRKDDLKNILKIISSFGISSDRVLLMAEGISQKSQMSNKWLHDICLEHRFRLTPRLHILIFGSKRGV